MNITVLDSNGKEMTVRVLDFLPYDNDGENKIAFFFAGELMSNDLYIGSYNWTLAYATVSIKQLKELTMESQKHHLII